MRYLVTGGSGYIGSRLVQRLLDRDDTERILVADVRPPRAFNPTVEYAEMDVRDKAECDRLCQLWALRNPDRAMTIVRPCIVMGPNVDNYIVRLWTDQPFQADFGLPDNDYQFIHEDDLVDAIIGLIAGKHSGAYNIAGDGVIPGAELAEMIGMPRRKIPLKLYWRLAAAMWKLRQSETPPGNLHFAIHPWVASNEKVKATLGWEPRYSSLEAFQEAMRARGKLPRDGTPVGADVGAPVGV